MNRRQKKKRLKLIDAYGFTTWKAQRAFWRGYTGSNRVTSGRRIYVLRHKHLRKKEKEFRFVF